jgi:hypothetical protein
MANKEKKISKKMREEFYKALPIVAKKYVEKVWIDWYKNALEEKKRGLDQAK